MIYFERRKYSRDEMAIIFRLDPKDKNFKRKVITRLQNLGMGEEDYTYTSKDVTILWVPANREEKITYLVRLLGIDKQVDPSAFSTFVYAMLEYPEYQRMPWGERTELFNSTFGFNLSQRTLESWMAKMIDLKIMYKDKTESSLWCTTNINGQRIRTEVEKEEEIEEYKRYLKRKFEIFQETKNWNETFKQLWSEFHCVYYKCGSFVGKPWADNEIIYELLDLIAGLVEDQR